MGTSLASIPEPGAGSDSAGRDAAAGARRDAVWVAVLFAFALVLRLVCLAEMRRDVLFEHPVIDQLDYVEWGRLVAASGYSEPRPFPRPPGTPYALALVFRLAGPGLLAPRLVQCVLSAALVLLVFAVGRVWFGRRAAFAAALVAALHPVLIHAATELMPTTWVTFLDLLALYCLVQAGRRRARGWVLTSGVVLGLSTLFLPTILLFVPVALVWLWREFGAAGEAMPAGSPPGRAGTRRAVAVVLLVAGWGLAVLPVTIRNAVRGHDVVLVAANDGINFWIGNNPDYARTFGIRPGREYQDLEWEPVAHGAGKPSRESAYYFRKAFRFFAAHPAPAAALQARKLYLFFHGAEIPRSSDIYLARDESRLLRVLVWKRPLRFPDAILMPLGLVGVAASWSRRRRLALPLGFAATQVLGVCAFFVSSRYRVPSLPVWVLLGGAGAGWLAGEMRRAAWPRRAVLGAGVAVLFVLLQLPVRETQIDLRGEEAFYRAQGAYEEHDLAAARAHLERALALDATNNDAWDLLGRVLDASGEAEAALAAWRRAAELDPLAVETGRLLAHALEKRGDLDGAIAALRANLEHVRDPRGYANDYSEDLLQVARLYARKGDDRSALEAAEAAVQFNPENRAAPRLRDEIARRLRAQPDSTGR